jgi:hypothetical protein
MRLPILLLLMPLLMAAPAAMVQAASPQAASPQDRPRVQPDRDVTVTYRVEGAATQAIPGGIDGPLRLSWDAAGQRLRAEPANRPQAVIVDLPRHTASVVDDMMHAVLTLPVRERDLQPLTLDGVQMTRRGTVAGRACTTWAMQSKRGAGAVCLTADGVALRAEGEIDGRHGSFTATNVAYGAVAADLFTAPPGYMTLNIPDFGRKR